MTLLLYLGIVLVSSIVIFYAGERFATSSSLIGDYLKLPRDVKGATFDAVSSSLPEILVALYSVVFFHHFEVGIGTIAGSALFNLLVIPGICVFVSPVVFKISKKVISRDAIFYLVSVFVLIVLVLYFHEWGIIISISLISIYLFYLRDIISYTKQVKHDREAGDEEEPEDNQNINLKKELFFFFGLMVVIGLFTFLLTDAAIKISEILEISPTIIAFTIIAAATSVPDTVISVVNAKNGDIDDATSNVFGSNIFDILVGIGLPLFIYVLIKGPVIIEFDNIEVILGLMGTTILMLYFFSDNRTLNKKQAFALLAFYFVFVTYIILIALYPELMATVKYLH